PWTDELRSLVAGGGPARLKAHLARVDGSQLTPGLLSLLEAHQGLEERLDLLRAAQRRSPGDFWLNFSLGNALITKGRAGEAVGYLQAVLAVRPSRSAVLNNLGAALKATGRTDEAFAAFREAVRLDKANPLARFNYAVALAEKRLLDEA